MANEDPTTSKSAKLSYDEPQIIKLMKNDKDRITFEPHASENRMKNTDYKRFKRIIVDNSSTEFLICEEFPDTDLIKHHKGSGTQVLINHINRFHKSSKTVQSSQTKMNQFTVQRVIQADKSDIADKCAMFCAKDMRPFLIVEGTGFIDLAQALIKLASIKGLIDAKELLPTAVAVKNHLDKIYGSLKVSLIEVLSSVDYINCTCDHWEDEYVKQSYMTITIQYIDQSKASVVTRLIGTFGVDDKTSKTTRNKVIEYLDAFKVRTKVKIMTTDNASAMKAAFNEVNFDQKERLDVIWIGCAAHNLSLVHKYSYGDEMYGDPIPTITSLINSCKTLVTYVKKSGLNNELEHRLKQEVNTRWDSYYDMLKSVNDNFDELLQHECLDDKMNKIYHPLLTELVAFLCEIITKIFYMNIYI